jgi:hypothetical protein
MLNKLVTRHIRNLQRVYTRKNSAGNTDERYAHEIVGRSTRTHTDGSCVTTLRFRGGRTVTVTVCETA